MGIMMPETCWVNLKVNKHLYLCHPLVLSSPSHAGVFPHDRTWNPGLAAAKDWGEGWFFPVPTWTIRYYLWYFDLRSSRALSRNIKTINSYFFTECEMHSEVEVKFSRFVPWRHMGRCKFPTLPVIFSLSTRWRGFVTFTSRPFYVRRKYTDNRWVRCWVGTPVNMDTTQMG